MKKKYNGNDKRDSEMNAFNIKVEPNRGKKYKKTGKKALQRITQIKYGLSV